MAVRLKLINQDTATIEKVKKMYNDLWLKDSYKYIFPSYFPQLEIDPDGFRNECYVAFDHLTDEIISFYDIGVVKFPFRFDINLAINFKLAFEESHKFMIENALAMRELIKMLMKRKPVAISWYCHGKNPVATSYRKLAETLGGCQDGCFKNHIQHWDGELDDLPHFTV
jgi:hypothetical protein